KLSAGFAAGMGCMESTCGALIGAVMVAGNITGGQGTPRFSRELVNNFREKCGATICKDLKGVATGVELCPCPQCVKNAVLAVGEVLGE
ncbi:MAG: C_GCAxxG_C_C family protein, partial [Lachnospiraceae bacterium]|nr:C_GCAxxG_C_C family protein [Lachnospiraceae bacterium]